MNKLLKKAMTLTLVGVIGIGGAGLSFADAPTPEIAICEAVPTLYSETAVPTLYDEAAVPTLYNEAPTKVLISAKPVLISTQEILTVKVGEEVIEYTVLPQVIDGKVMLPLAETLKALGYEYTWNGETKSVDIMKGNQFTTVYIGKNAYFRNKMAPRPLTAAPVIVEGRTMVPVEFFTDNRGHGITLEDGVLTFLEEEATTHSGLIREITVSERGGYTITIAPNMETQEMMDYTIIHTSETDTIINADSVEVGAFITAVTPPIMTMSIPAQTSAYVIY